jgi:hypothetical protein
VIARAPAPIVSFPYDVPANSILIDTGARKLYYVLADKKAYEYRIGVGREGFNWTGTETISRQQAWPDWYPPAEMRERDPKLPDKMTGGIKNPLGAMALYLGNTLYRIHGTNDWKSIGRSESSGCFRMLNSAVLHLASITQIGTPVTVVSSLRKHDEVSRAPATPLPEKGKSAPPADEAKASPPPDEAKSSPPKDEAKPSPPPDEPKSPPPPEDAKPTPPPLQADSPPPRKEANSPGPAASNDRPQAEFTAPDYRALRDFMLKTR